jgi:hypothetical protein
VRSCTKSIPYTSFFIEDRRRLRPFSPVPIHLRFTRVWDTSSTSRRHGRFISLRPTDQRSVCREFMM